MPTAKTQNSSVVAVCQTWLARSADWLAVAGALLAIGIFSHLMIRHQMDVVPEIDSQGYFLMARAFSQFEWPRWTEDLGRFYGHIWVDVGDGQVMCKYTPGWPLVLAIGYWIYGLAGALWVNPILAIIGAVAFYLLALELFNRTAAFVCTVIWLFAPMVPAYMVYPLTHGPDTAFVLLAFLFAVRWARTRSPVDAIIAGFCCGFIPLIRPTNVLLWPAIAMVAYAQLREKGNSFPRLRAWLMPFGVTFAIPVLFFVIFNWVSFGAPWRTGYSLSGEQTGFSYAALGERLHKLFEGRPSLLEEKYWLLFLVALLFRQGRMLLLGGLLLWFVPMLVLHAGYYFFFNGAVFFRFIIACLPACVLAIGFLLSGRWIQFAPVRFAVVVGFLTWFVYSPPRIFDTLTELRLGRRYSWDELKHDPQLGLACLLYGPGKDRDFVKDVDNEAKGKPAVIYSTGSSGWTAGAESDVINYDVNAWLSSHYAEPVEARCARGVVWEDLSRHRCYHEWHGTLTPAGVSQDFVSQIMTNLERGRAVYLAGREAESALPWLEEHPDLKVETLQRRFWRITAQPTTDHAAESLSLPLR